MEPCGNVEAAGAFGIISMVLFTVDTVLYCIKNRNTRAAQPPTPYDGDNIDDVQPTESTETNYWQNTLRWSKKSETF